ncbi:hypothetical protein NDU88_002130 [Pleurodeles waltl]|uniref:Uncharacterized protein n=1 Tax=Pleurodeles waltl TaxID=8319 RepID=A0AAV7S9J2_PLEWA|nr:hypothetical protein NDU88_002130 [Pleurodeles waltl]
MSFFWLRRSLIHRVTQHGPEEGGIRRALVQLYGCCCYHCSASKSTIDTYHWYACLAAPLLRRPACRALLTGLPLGLPRSPGPAELSDQRRTQRSSVLRAPRLETRAPLASQ